MDIVTSQQYILRHGRLGLEYPNKPPILEIAGIHRTEVMKPRYIAAAKRSSSRLSTAYGHAI